MIFLYYEITLPITTNQYIPNICYINLLCYVKSNTFHGNKASITNVISQLSSQALIKHMCIYSNNKSRYIMYLFIN